MGEKKYTIEAVASRIEHLLGVVHKHGHLHFSHKIIDGVNPHPDIENPELVVQFSGPDVDILLANKQAHFLIHPNPFASRLPVKLAYLEAHRYSFFARPPAAFPAPLPAHRYWLYPRAH